MHMLKRALDDLDSELTAYRKLSAMLDDQFRTARQLDTTALARITADIAHEVGYLDQCQRARSQLLTVADTLARRLPEPRGRTARSAVARRCQELKALALQCRTATLRNGQLLAAQHDMMRRILHGEQATYAPR